MVNTEYENNPWIHHRLGNIWPDEAMDVISRTGFSDEFSHKRCRSSGCTWVESQREGIISDQSF